MTLGVTLSIGFYFYWRMTLMGGRERNIIISSIEFLDLEKEEPYKLKGSNVKIYASIGDVDFDNDDNEYGTIEMHYYSNRETRNTTYPKDNVKMVPCDVENAGEIYKQLWHPGLVYCPEWSDEHALFTNYNYDIHSWLRLAVHKCDPEQRAKVGKSCKSDQEIDKYFDSNLYAGSI
jgi:hypothetical protein